MEWHVVTGCTRRTCLRPAPILTYWVAPHGVALNRQDSLHEAAVVVWHRVQANVRVCARAHGRGGRGSSAERTGQPCCVAWPCGVAWLAHAVVRATKGCTPPGTRCEPNPRCRLARQRNCATAACGGVARKQALGLLGAPWQTCIPAWAHANSVGVLLQVGKSHATRHICAGDHAHRATCTTNKQRTRSKSNTRTGVQRSRWCGIAGLFADECWLESGCCAAAHSVCYFRRRCFGVWQKARPCFGTHFLVHTTRAHGVAGKQPSRRGEATTVTAWRRGIKRCCVEL